MGVYVQKHTSHSKQFYKKADVFSSTTGLITQEATCSLEVTELLKGRVKGQQTAITAQSRPEFPGSLVLPYQHDRGFQPLASRAQYAQF